MLRNAKPLPGHATAKPLVKEEPLNPQQQQPCATAMPAQQQRGAPSAAALVPPRHDLLTKKRRFANRGVLLEVEAGEDPRSKPSQSIQRNNDDNNTNSTIHDPLWQDFGLSRCRARSDQQQQNAPPKKKPRSRPTAQKRGPPRRGAAPNNSATAFTLFPTKTTTTEPTTTKRSQLSLSKNAKQDEPGPLPGVVGIGEGPTYTGTTTATATASIPPTGPGDSVVSSETRTIPTPPGCNNKNNNIHWSRNIVHALILASYKTNNNKTKNGNIQGFYQHVRHSCPPTATTIDTKAQPPDTPSPPACFVFPDTRRMPPPPPRVPWTIPSWLRLVQHPHDDGMPGSSRRKKVVSAMAWDTTGELLAVGFAASGGGGDAALTSQVNIYNWDTVVAANMKGRRLQQRRLMSNRRCGCEQTVPSGSRERTSPKMALDGLFVPPAMIIPISCRSSISMLEWNPFNPDELAVGERYVPSADLSFVWQIALHASY